MVKVLAGALIMWLKPKRIPVLQHVTRWRCTGATQTRGWTRLTWYLSQPLVLSHCIHPLPSCPKRGTQGTLKAGMRSGRLGHRTATVRTPHLQKGCAPVCQACVVKCIWCQAGGMHYERARVTLVWLNPDLGTRVQKIGEWKRNNWTSKENISRAPLPVYTETFCLAKRPWQGFTQ